MLLHYNGKHVWRAVLCCAVLFCVLSCTVMAGETELYGTANSAQGGALLETGTSFAAEDPQDGASVSLLSVISVSRIDSGISVQMPMEDCALAYAAAYSDEGKMLGVTSLTAGAAVIDCDPVLATQVRFFQLEADFVPSASALCIDLTEEKTMEAPGYTHELLSFIPSHDYVVMAFRYTGEGTEWQDFEINSIRVNGLECGMDIMSRAELAEQLAEAEVTLEEAGCERAFIAAYIYFDYTAAVAAATEHQPVGEGYEPVLAFAFDVSGEMADGSVHTESFTIRYLDYGYGGWL